MLSDDDLRKNIRNNLTAMRMAKGLTQTEVGKIVGKKSTTVASWEQGLSLPDLQTLYKLSIYYEKSLEWFYENGKGDDALCGSTDPADASAL